MLEVERPGDELAWRSFASARRGRVEDGDELRLPRRVGGRRHPAPRRGGVGGQRRRRGPARPHGARGGRAHPVRRPWRAARGADGSHRPRRRPRGRGRLRPQRDARLAAVRGAPRGAACRTPRSTRPPCTFCRIVHADADGGSGRCTPTASPWRQCAPSPGSCSRRQSEPRARRLHADYRPPPPFRADCRAALARRGERGAVVCVYPAEGASVYVPLEIDR